jgi:sarcosine oxidase subunit alpha
MNVRAGRIAGVDDCVLWRIGFTGELSYELHVPAGYGRHVWEALLAGGKDLGVAPFGVEAQRILRLEQGHIRDDAGGTRSYLLHCERSVGQYLFDALLKAGAEYGLTVDGLR